MSVRRFFNKQLVVRKLKTTTGYKKTFKATATTEGGIQRTTGLQTDQGAGIWGESYIGFLPIDLGFTPAPEDMVSDGDGREFRVKTVEKIDFGINQHWELELEEYNPQDQ